MEEGVDFLVLGGGVSVVFYWLEGNALFWRTSWNSVTAMASILFLTVERCFVVEEEDWPEKACPERIVLRFDVFCDFSIRFRIVERYFVVEGSNCEGVN